MFWVNLLVYGSVLFEIYPSFILREDNVTYLIYADLHECIDICSLLTENLGDDFSVTVNDAGLL